jgi:hypothetical protein
LRSLSSIELTVFVHHLQGPPSQSGGEEEEQQSYPSPPRQTIPLAAISETDDALASGSESDASSDGEQRRLPRQVFSQDDYAPSRKSRDSGGLSENVALKSGYLMKKGERRKAWKKRWFVLRGGNLAMYKSDKVRLAIEVLDHLISLTPVCFLHRNIDSSASSPSPRSIWQLRLR